jgi:predicted small lipoprotein YifL
LFSDRKSIGFALVLLGVVAFGLTACGRAGPLELPPGPAATPAPTASAAPPPSAPSAAIGGPVGTSVAGGPGSAEQVQKNGFDQYGNPIAPTGEKKSFLLDFLLQ